MAGATATSVSTTVDQADVEPVAKAPAHRLIGLPAPPEPVTPELLPALQKLLRLLPAIAGSEVPVRSLVARASSLRRRAAELAVTDRTSFEAACDLGLRAKEIIADAEGSALDELKTLAHGAHKELTGLLARLTKEPKAVEELVKESLVEFCRQEAEEHRLRELERHARLVEQAKSRRTREVAALRLADRGEEADRLERSPVKVPFVPQPYEVVPVAGVSISVSGYRVVVVDESLVPEDLRMSVVDQAALEARAAATGFAVEIPGVEFVADYRVAISAR